MSVKRCETCEKVKEIRKEERYNKYLELKMEFEN